MARARVTRRARLLVIAPIAALVIAATAANLPDAHTGAAGSGDIAAARAFSGPETGRAAVAGPDPLMCIDPGHSLSTPGMAVTVSTFDADGRAREVELREVDVNIDVAREVVLRLRERFGDEAVVMTWGEADNRARAWNALRGPDGDEKPDVMARGTFCVAQGARSIASLHTNWFDDEPNGTLTGYRDENDRALAEAIHARIRDAVAVTPAGRPVPDLIDYGLDQGDWFVTLALGDRDVPAVIIEPVMTSDPDEARRLLPSIAEAPSGRRAQIAAVEAEALGDWIASTLLGER